jgi:AP-3 complex subunit sigma
MRSNPRVVAISFALAPALVRPSLVHSLNRSLPPFFLRLAAMVRLCRFYEQLGVDKQADLCQTVYKMVTGRPDHLCSFVDDEKTFGPDTKLVYRHFATLYFCILSDRSESELAMLDLIQVYVETLDKVFENVCELDLIFNSPKAYTVLDETIVGGLVLEINSQKVIGVYEELMKLEKAQASMLERVTG